MNIRTMSAEQRIAWGRHELAEMRHGKPKSHQEFMAAMEFAQIRQRAIGASAADARKIIEEAKEADRQLVARLAMPHDTAVKPKPQDEY